MKPVFIGLITIFVLATFSLGGTLPSDAAREEVLALERHYEKAVAEQDVKALDRILADDFIAISSRAEVRDKKLEIDDIKPNPDYKLESFKLDEIKIRVYGQTAIVTGRSTLQASFRGNSSKSVFRYTRAYAKRAGRWQAVAQQLTRLAQ